MYNVESENATSPVTIDHFHRILYWPHMVAYLIYLIQKCLIFLALIDNFIDEFKIKCCWKRISNLFQCLFDLSGLIILCATCCYGCVCCCSCCFNTKFEEKVTKLFFSFWYKSRVKFDRWVVKIVLGKDERIVSRVDDYVNDKVDKDGIPTLYIHGKRLTHIHIRALYILILVFGLLTFGSAWSTFIFNITHICVDDHPNIYCFAVPSDYDTSLSISKERVTNCSSWSDSNDIEFTCFQYAYNTADALATFGGLLALFQITVTTIASVIISFIQFIFSFSCAQQTQDDTLQCCIKCTRYVISVLATVIEVGVAVSIAILLKIQDEPSIGVISGFLLNHGSQILIVFAIIGMIPLLPLEEYVTNSQSQVNEDLDTSSTTSLISQNASNEQFNSLA